MGWNHISPEHHDLFSGITDPRFYFVHSYYADVPEENNLATCYHGKEFCCAIISGNTVGVQFHPEKSHKYGMKLFTNYLSMK